MKYMKYLEKIEKTEILSLLVMMVSVVFLSAVDYCRIMIRKQDLLEPFLFKPPEKH